MSTSRYWLNYRHSANVMSMYRILRRLGFPDSNIILMLSDDHACNPRNPFKGTLFSNESHATNVYGDEVEVDYRGYEVTVDNLLRVLTGARRGSSGWGARGAAPAGWKQPASRRSSAA